MGEAGPARWYKVWKGHNQRAAKQDFCEHNCTIALTQINIGALHLGKFGLNRPNQHPRELPSTINHAQGSGCIRYLGCRTDQENCNVGQIDREGKIQVRQLDSH